MASPIWKAFVAKTKDMTGGSQMAQGKPPPNILGYATEAVTKATVPVMAKIMGSETKAPPVPGESSATPARGKRRRTPNRGRTGTLLNTVDNPREYLGG